MRLFNHSFQAGEMKSSHGEGREEGSPRSPRDETYKCTVINGPMGIMQHLAQS